MGNMSYILVRACLEGRARWAKEQQGVGEPGQLMKQARADSDDDDSDNDKSDDKEDSDSDMDIDSTTASAITK